MFFDGDLETFRDRGRAHQSFRALAEREDLHYTGIWLWRAVCIFDQMGHLPEGLASSLSYTHHTLLLPLPVDTKVALAQRVVEDGWTTGRLQSEVARLRARDQRKVGRPALPSIVKTVNRIGTLLTDDSLAGLDAIASMDSAEQRRFHRTVKQALRRLEAVDEELQLLASAGEE